MLFEKDRAMNNSVYCNFMCVEAREGTKKLDAASLSVSDVVDITFTIGSYQSQNMGMGLVLMPLGIERIKKKEFIVLEELNLLAPPAKKLKVNRFSDE